MPKYDPKNSDFEDVPSIGPQNPNAVRVETPNTLEGFFRAKSQELNKKMSGKLPLMASTPTDKAMSGQMLNAASGAALAPSGKLMAEPIKATGRQVRSLVDYIGGKLSGLSPEMVQSYKAAPQTVEALASAPEVRQSQFAEKALGSASNRIGNRAKDLNTALQEQFQGKTVPESAISTAEKFRPNKSSIGTLVGDANVPASDVYQAAREAGKAAKFSPNPIDPIKERARVEAAGREFATLRGAVSKAVPEAEQTISDLQSGIEAQSGLKGGRNRPLGYFGSNAPDTAANRQAADQILDSTRLERTAGQLQAAKQLQQEPHGLANKFLKPVGKAMIRTNAAIAPVAGKIADKSSDALTKYLFGLKTDLKAPAQMATPQYLTPANAGDFEEVK